MKRDAVLVREPQQGSRVSDNRMIDCAFVLRNLDAFQPLGKTLRNVLLKEPGCAYAAVIALHRHRPTPDVRQHHRGNARVVRREFSLGDAVIGEKEFLWMTNHSFTTSHSALSGRTPTRSICRRRRSRPGYLR